MSNLLNIKIGGKKKYISNKTSRKTSKRKKSKRKTSKRKTSKRKTSKRKKSKRKPSKRKTSKLKINHNTFNIYTDGSTINNCRNGYNSSGGIGVFIDNNEFQKLSEPFFIYPITNNRCELYACIRAIQYMNKKIKNNRTIKNLIIYTDSEYTINSLSIWIKMWKRRGWKTATGRKPINLDLIFWFDKLRQLYKNKFTIEFKHVKAHQNKPKNKNSISHWLGNKEADMLAKRGMVISKKLIKKCL